MATKTNKKKPRKINSLPIIQNRFYIFCEGTKTEPQYFEQFAKKVAENPVYKNLIHVEGVGAETLRVLYAAEKYVEQNAITQGEIWCVYDKDGFPAQDFNAVSERVKNLNETQKDVRYQVAWSNQCVEYWFILHFDSYDADNDRKYYIDYLDAKFVSLQIGRYKKNDPNIFKTVTMEGNPKLAIKRAKKRLKSCEGMTDANSAPATKVHLLVEKLAEYLPEDTKNRYL